MTSGRWNRRRNSRTALNRAALRVRRVARPRWRSMRPRVARHRPTSVSKSASSSPRMTSVRTGDRRSPGAPVGANAATMPSVEFAVMMDEDLSESGCSGAWWPEQDRTTPLRRRPVLRARPAPASHAACASATAVARVTASEAGDTRRPRAHERRGHVAAHDTPP